MKSLKLKTLTAVASGLVGFSLCSFGAAKLSDSTELFVTGEAAVQYEDNLFRNATEEEDIAFILTPGVEIVFNDGAALTASLSYAHEFRYYDDNSDLDDDFAHFSAKAAYNSGVILADVYAKYDEINSNVFNVAAGFVQREITKAGTSAKYQFSDLTAAKIGLNYRQTDYVPTTLFDSESVSVPVTFFYKVRPNVDLTAGVRYREVDTDRPGASFSFDDTYFFIGAEGELFSPKVNATIDIGWQDRDAKGIAGDNSSASYKAKIIYLANAKSSYFLVLDRDFKEASVNGNSYVQTIATLGTTYSLSSAITVNGSAGAGEYEYEGSVRAEDLVFFNLGATYAPSENLSLKVSYQYQDVDGNGGLGGASDYTNNSLTFSASLRY